MSDYEAHVIWCNCPSKGKGLTPKYLGDFQLLPGNHARHHCKNCNTTYLHSVDEHGIVTKSIVKGRVFYSQTKARIG